MPDKIGVAFVGCTHPHIFPRLEILRAEKDVEFIGCYDPDTHLMQALEQDHGLRAFDTPQELLDQPGANFTIIEGWDPANPGYAREALKRNQAILLEKPGAPNLIEMKDLVAEVRKTPVPFQVGYMLPFSSAIRYTQRILNEGLLGPVTLARFHAAAPVGGARERWQSVPGDQGGVVYTDGCHMINIMIRLLGMPRSVKGMILTLPEGENVLAHGFKHDTLSGLGETLEMPLGGLMYEDCGAAIFDYGNKLATFDITGWEAQPWVEAWSIELYGTDGTLYVGLVPPWYRLYLRNPKQGYASGWHSWKSLGGSTVGNSLVVDENYTGEMHHMLERVRQWDTKNEPWLAEAEGVITLLDAIFRSNRDGAITL
jgi:predicted dehydrogenase